MSRRLFESWGIFFEGPFRKTARSVLADLLDVEGAQFPILSWVRKHFEGIVDVS